MIKKLQVIGWDGLAMLAVSNTIILASFGLTLLLPLFYVVRIAVNTSSSIAPTRCLIVPGMCLENNAPNAEFRCRLDRVVSLLGTSIVDGRKVFILGGLTGGNSVSEASAGQAYLQQQGLPTQCVVLEEKSSNTLENFRFAKALIEGQGEAVVVLITSRYHLARCGVMANSLGIAHQLCAAEAYFRPGINTVLCILKEAYHLHWYFSGRCWATLTGNKKMLTRLR